MSPLETLRAARALIATPSSWCKDYEAVDVYGVSADAIEPQAVAWCLVGACARAAGDGRTSSPVTLELDLTVLRGQRPYISAVDLNDAEAATHADVLAVLDETIARLAAEVQP